MITLASDFGSPYPAAMKGVLLQRTDARLLDVTHALPRQDPNAAAFWLRAVLPYVPPSVHLVVVDPGVGTERRALVVRAGDHALVGADNGALLPPARVLARADPTPVPPVGTSVEGGANGGESIECFAVNPDRLAVAASATFHGRDVFAPIAAEVHDRGVDALEEHPDLERFEDPTELRFPLAVYPEQDVALATVLVVDDFGNAITNVPGRWLERSDSGTVLVEGRSVPAVESYAGVEPGEALVTVGSHGQVELAVNRGRGSAAFDVEPGTTVELGRNHR